MKALIFAAGKGTRLKPFTDHHPKALALVNGIPLLERNIKYLQSFGINDFVINVFHFGEQIVEFLNIREVIMFFILTMTNSANVRRSWKSMNYR